MLYMLVWKNFFDYGYVSPENIFDLPPPVDNIFGKNLYDLEMLVKTWNPPPPMLMASRRPWDGVKNQIQGVETSQSFISDKYENVIEVTQSIKKEMKTVQSHRKESNERLECLEKEASYNMAVLDEVQQYLRRDCLEITGIPIVPLDDPSTLVSEVCSAMDIELQEDDIYQLLTGFLQQQSLKTELLWNLLSEASETGSTSIDQN